MGTFTTASAETEPNSIFAVMGKETVVFDFEYNLSGPLPVDPIVGPYDPITGIMLESPTEVLDGMDIIGDAYPAPESPTLPSVVVGVMGLFLFARKHFPPRSGKETILKAALMPLQERR